MVAWIGTAPFVVWAVIRLFGLDGGYPLEAMAAASSRPTQRERQGDRHQSAASTAAVDVGGKHAQRLPPGRARLRYHVLDAAPSSSGTAIFSRFPLRRLPTPSYRFLMAHAEARLPGGRRLRIVAVHPFPPTNPIVTGEWEEVLSTLPSGGRGTPWLLAGDFNATLDQAPFRDLVGRGYRDAGEVAGKGLDATFPADGSLLPPPITIDHILADERFGIVEYEVEPLPASDHRAIFARLALPAASSDR